jgi:hypothetical protein
LEFCAALDAAPNPSFHGILGTLVRHRTSARTAAGTAIPRRSVLTRWPMETVRSVAATGLEPASALTALVGALSAREVHALLRKHSITPLPVAESA